MVNPVMKCYRKSYEKYRNTFFLIGIIPTKLKIAFVTLVVFKTNDKEIFQTVDQYNISSSMPF